MAYLAAAVANELLDRAEKDHRPLTQIGLQKLVYFAHGWHLGLKGEPLILESIEAWQYGPVVRNLYSQFKRFGSAPITDRAHEFSVNTFGEPITSNPSIAGDNAEADEYAKSLVGAIWRKYGSLEPFQLVELTHAIDSPWEEAWKTERVVIPNETIRAYFSKLAAA